MKLAALILALASLSAQAETIDLIPGGQCTSNCTCQGVPTDVEGLTVWLNPTTVAVEDSIYTGSSVYPSQMFDKAGNVAVVTLSFHRYSTRSSSGRGGGYAVQHCAFTGGTLVR